MLPRFLASSIRLSHLRLLFVFVAVAVAVAVSVSVSVSAFGSGGAASGSSAGASAAGADFTEPAPFWHGNAKLQERIEDERAILVSVRSSDVPIGVRFSFRGVGLVKRDRSEVLQLAMHFEELKGLSDHFKEVKWEPKIKQLFVIGQALGYQARMLLQIEKVGGITPTRDEIRFKVIDGHFLGLQGALVLETRKPGATEMSIWCLQEAKQLPLPRILLGFALEIIAQRVAGKMRDHLETMALP